MKEAAGEANMTVITIILIGVIAAIAVPLITSVMTSTSKSSCCQASGYVWDNGKCKDSNNNTVNDGNYWDKENKKCLN